MRADPKPGDGIAFLHPNRAPVKANANGVNGPFCMDPFEFERLMIGIVLPEFIGAFCLTLDGARQGLERPPKSSGCERGHERELA